MGDGTDGEGRVGFLDTLRGVAILGILPVNAAFFAYPVTLADSPQWPPGALNESLAWGVWAGFEMKFVTIFSLLFGVGIAVMRERASARGGRSWPILVRRLVVLGFFGIAHALLLWYGDIVGYYAGVGLALFWTASWSPRALRIGALVGLTLSLLPYVAALVAVLAGDAWTTGLVRGAAVPVLPDGRHGAWTPGSWDGFADRLMEFDPDFETTVYGGDSFKEILAMRAATWGAAAVAIVPLFGARIAGMFLLGMAWAKEGWFLAPGSDEGRRRFGLLLRRGLAAGVPLTLAAVGLRLLAPDEPAASVGAEILQYAGSLGLAAAYVALVARACVSRPGSAVVRALAAAGRMAFTNYLLQSVVMTLLFYGSTVFLGAGLGWFGSVDRAPLLGIVALLAAAQVGASVLWLRRFRMGPVEWLWRAATYLEFPPMRRGEKPG